MILKKSLAKLVREYGKSKGLDNMESKPKKCKYISNKTGKQCKNNSIVIGYCTTHYWMTRKKKQ